MAEGALSSLLGRLRGATRHLRCAARYLKLAVRALVTTHVHEHPTYSAEELLARAEEFNANAEKHWRKIASDAAGHAHVLNKPFSTVRDTPGILYKLGLVLSELDLGVGQTVLDFGAGSCWLSSSLNRLRCRTVAVDVSPTALLLGEELFRADSRHDMALDPQFLPYDGHKIPLPSQSVDRAVCFDSFHHVPNQEEVLAELFRVLRPGGRLVLAEPGEGHAHMDQSVFETEAHGVLENDLHLDDLVARARATGFDLFTVKPYPDAGAFSFPVETYFAFMDGDDGVYPLQLLRENLRHFFIMVLAKGEPRVDSRNPRVLRATIAPEASSLAGVATTELPFRVRVTNAGDTTWLHEETRAGGYVMLGGHLLDEEQEIVSRGFLRAALPRDVKPGETVLVDARLPVPAKPGRYVVQLDMVDEFVAWFEQCGSKVVETPLRVEPRPSPRLAASLELVARAPSGPVDPGAPIALTVRARNTGTGAWAVGAPGQHGTVSLGARLLDAGGRTMVQDYVRVPLPRSIAPEEEATLSAEVPAPPEPGQYRLQLDLVAEGVCWFAHAGSAPLDLIVETTGRTPDSLHPGTLSAAIELKPARGEVSLGPGAEVPLSLRVTNTGNTLWLHAPGNHRGHVALGGHLLGEDRVSRNHDFLRIPLSRAVPPGESVDLAGAFQAPEEPGRYIVELDMVDEGIAWFGTRGSPTATILLTVRS